MLVLLCKVRSIFFNNETIYFFLNSFYEIQPYYKGVLAIMSSCYVGNLSLCDSYLLCAQSKVCVGCFALSVTLLVWGCGAFWFVWMSHNRQGEVASRRKILADFPLGFLYVLDRSIFCALDYGPSSLNFDS